MKRVNNILIVGVGGQGVLLASDILAQVALEEGFDVKKSEIHGMSQRGGSVFSHIRFGEKVYSPVIPEGCADFFLSFELLETTRWMYFLNKDTRVIYTDLKIPPSIVAAGKEKYPDNIDKIINENFKETIKIEINKHIKEISSTRYINTFLLGILSNFMPFNLETWKKSLNENIRRDKEKNLQVFLYGRKIETK